ncbi:flagellar export chaperone FliS [Paenibacillus sp. EC2-1]|uniref:flagellar export chaperone FliS n=1 Tax=Paenibacillus sp. EC2-1 TaxID=3388665 RepID=UPI003BEEF5DA
MINSPYQKYQQVQTQTASKPKLLIMLYDGAIRFVRSGIEGIEEQNIEKTNTNLCKAQAIIHELISSLNFDYPISKDLLSIYDYMVNQLIVANVKKSTNSATEVLEHLTELREAWIEASKAPGVGGAM